jgi:hypothetical protein
MTEQECETAQNEMAQGRMSYKEAMSVYVDALHDDPTESFHAAHIRDAIRENYSDGDQLW